MGFFRANKFCHILKFPLITYNVIFRYLNINSKFRLQVGFKNKKYKVFIFWNSPYSINYWQLQIFDQNFHLKNAHLLEKIPYEIEKFSSTKLFSFLILYSDFKFDQIWSALDQDITNFWFWAYIQNLKTRFVFKKHGPNEKKTLSTKSFCF